MSKQLLPRPVPEYSEEFESFWMGVNEDIFLLQRCADCRLVRWPPKPACPRCFSTNGSAVTSQGRGVVWSFTVVYAASSALGSGGHFVSVIVALDDAPETLRVPAWLTGTSPGDVYIGMPVRIAFVDGPRAGQRRFEFIPDRPA